MPNQVISNVENNFTRGLITESTGMNFPENAATSTSNCQFTLVGDTTRRLGINQELNGTLLPTQSQGLGMSTYVWNNPGGDGNSKLLVKQLGENLFFYNIAASTVASPLSTKILSSQVSLNTFSSQGPTVFDSTKEAQYADGNGYLFVYHSNIDPIYVTYDPNTTIVTAFRINVLIRDFVGVVDNLAVNTRPSVLSAQHNYNLVNQGWVTGNPWAVGSSTNYVVGTTGNVNFNIGTVSGVVNGQTVTITVGGSPTNPFLQTQGQGFWVGSGTVTNYVAPTITINITSALSTPPYVGQSDTSWTITPVSSGYINTFFTAAGVYPSNADVWWYFKNSSGVFDPATTITNVNLSQGQSPQGHFTLSAWIQDRNVASGLSGLTAVNTLVRPTTGAWFQGRVWFAGMNAAQQAAGDANNYNWSANIYFSQVALDPANFGNCYQNNDPTSETLNDLLPTDGGVITIHEAGFIYKLFPIANGMLVFASNGVWFITGSQGIGFSANDYTINKISSVKIISATSFVDVLGLPYFWNEEGIYRVVTSQSGQLSVEPLTVGTILSFYNSIPSSSKKYARGDYDPIGYTIQWCYRSVPETDTADRYDFESILNFNTYNKAFYPYSVGLTADGHYIHGINYVQYPFISTITPEPGFKYHYSFNNSIADFHGFSEEFDTSYLDWGTVNYVSTFTVGYKLHGKAVYRFQTPYVYTYSRNDGYSAFYIQGLWDYGNNSNSHWTQPQFIEINEANTSTAFRRHRIRGRGLVLQLMFTSVQGQPFDIIGWSVYENLNTGV